MLYFGNFVAMLLIATLYYPISYSLDELHEKKEHKLKRRVKRDSKKQLIVLTSSFLILVAISSKIFAGWIGISWLVAFLAGFMPLAAMIIAALYLGVSLVSELS